MRSASTISSALVVSRSHSAGPPTLNVVNGASGTDARILSAPNRARICSVNTALRSAKRRLTIVKRGVGFFERARLKLDPVARGELSCQR